MDWILIWTVILSGLIIVFAILAFLTIIISIVGKINKSITNKNDNCDNNKKENLQKKSETKLNQKSAMKVSPPTTPKPIAMQQTASHEVSADVIAAISGAIAAMYGSDFKIKSIKKSSSRKRNLQNSGRNPWNMAAIVENTRPF